MSNSKIEIKDRKIAKIIYIHFCFYKSISPYYKKDRMVQADITKEFKEAIIEKNGKN